ncbi:hypothetical protein [Streptomyces sp. NPDC005953]|uniref:hypothetical protein n=1 Tax=Streptomyces sp. NPDC005953 TaxID=3156719 RepID=UPI0033E39C8B
MPGGAEAIPTANGALVAVSLVDPAAGAFAYPPSGTRGRSNGVARPVHLQAVS